MSATGIRLVHRRDVRVTLEELLDAVIAVRVQSTGPPRPIRLAAQFVRVASMTPTMVELAFRFTGVSAAHAKQLMSAARQPARRAPVASPPHVDAPGGSGASAAGAPAWAPARALKLPPAAAVARMLTELLGRPVSVEPAGNVPDTQTGEVGQLVDAAGELRALTWSSPAFVAVSGAALTVIPRGLSDVGIRAGTIPPPPEMVENHAEILNLVSALFNAVNEEEDLVKLDKVLACGADLPSMSQALLGRPRTRLDLVVEVPGYGSGNLSLLG